MVQHLSDTFEGGDQLRLFYQRWQGDNAPKAIVVIVHGLGEHSDRYPNVINRLLPEGYVIYALDHRGHGRSPGRRGHIKSWSEYRQDLRAFLELVWEREAGKPVFLLGHSLGGLMTLEYVLHHPDRLQGVIASAPGLSLAAAPPLLMLMSRVMSKLWPTMGVATGLDSTAVSRDPQVVKAYQDDPLVHGSATPRFATEMQAAIEWTLAHATEWQIPLLVLHGTADRLIAPEASAAFFAQVPVEDKDRIVYEGGYHEPHNDTNHQQVTADVLNWLEEHLPAR